MGSFHSDTDFDQMTIATPPRKAGMIGADSGATRGSNLSILRGKDDYDAWAAEIKGELGRMGIAYILDYYGKLDLLKRYHNRMARILILQHVGSARAKRLCDGMGSSRQAWHLWSLLRTDIWRGCACQELKNGKIGRVEKLSVYKGTAQEGCTSCQLILDVIEEYEPGWTRASTTTMDVQIDGIEKIEKKTILIEVSSYGLAKVCLEEVPNWKEQFEFYIQPAIPNCLLANRDGLSAFLDPLSYGDLHMPRMWLKECIESHLGCAAADSKYMPTRLVDVGLLNDSELSLREGKLEPAPYVTLSYCWGSVGNILVTTRENIADHRQCIPYSRLPQTLKDAVTVCRRMGVRYLWVDALCIIQNDEHEQDWYAESGKMRHIYSNSLFSIAADVSRNSKEGFLRGKYDSPTWRIFSRTRGGTNHLVVLFRTSTGFKHKDSNALISSALSKRGWALQESILPNRILHFTADEVVWECNTHCRCQCGQSSYSLVKVTCQGISKSRHLLPKYVPAYEDEHDQSKDIVNFLYSRTLDSVYWAWQTIVEYYTQRQLTNHLDKLTALSGLAQVAMDSHSFRRGDYLAGLWRGGLVKGLLWHVRGPLEPCRYTHYQAPSWSWASIDGGVKYFTEHYQFRFQEDIHISEAICDTSPLDPTGRVKGGYIMCTGLLIPVRVFVREDSTKHDVSMYIGYNGHAGRAHQDQLASVKTYRSSHDYEVLLDERLKFGQLENDHYCMQMGTTTDPHTGNARLWWLVLILRPRGIIDGEPCVMERVGIGYSHTRGDMLCDLFSYANERAVKLV